MAGRPPSDVSEAVREVVGAFDKAVNLVRRIEDRKDGKSDPEAVHDLYKSLALGPTIVQGYYDADSKRLGPAYTTGDFTAQMQLRDVLLHLKTLIGELQDVLLDEKQIDFRLLQDASDHCRVNAGVCLGQLSQRMSEARNPNAMFMQSPPAYMSGVPPMHNMQSPNMLYQSGYSMGRMTITPDQFPLPGFQMWDQKRPDSDQYLPQHQRKNTVASLEESFANWPVHNQYGDKDIDRRSDRRPSSNILTAEDGALLSPGLPQESLFPGQQDLVRNSYTSLSADGSLSRHSTQSSHLSRERFGPTDVGERPTTQSSHISRERFGPSDLGERPTTQSSHLSRERFGPDDFGDVGRDDTFTTNRGSTRSATSYASRANEPEPSPGQEATQPAPLRFGNRIPSGPQPIRQFSSGSPSAPPQRPVPSIPSQAPIQQNHYPGQGFLEQQRMPLPMPVPTQIQKDGQWGPFPPRIQSMAVTRNSPPPAPFTAPPPLHRVLTGNQTRQYNEYQQAQVPVPPIPSVHHPSLVLGHTPAQPPKPDQTQLLAATLSGPLSAPTQLINRTTSLAPSVAASDRSDSVSLPRPMSRSQPKSVALSQLSLPTEKNPQAFCKGAYRLFVGAKKAFIHAQRPVGMTTVIPYWCCDKCRFEGPMHSIPGPPDKKGRPGKGEKVFDLTARECGPISTAIVGPDGRGEGSGGIRYKWSFLAKCHVPMKMPAEKNDGTAGSFCCIFCVAEGAARGWLPPAQTFSDTSSTFSGKSGSVGGGVSDTLGTTRVFGNFTSFMDHLHVHRREEMWPGDEMRERMNCIVGRAATNRESWEINFLPIEGV